MSQEQCGLWGAYRCDYIPVCSCGVLPARRRHLLRPLFQRVLAVRIFQVDQQEFRFVQPSDCPVLLQVIEIVFAFHQPVCERDIGLWLQPDLRRIIVLRKRRRLIVVCNEQLRIRVLRRRNYPAKGTM